MFLGSGKLLEFSRLHLHTKTATILAIEVPYRLVEYLEHLH